MEEGTTGKRKTYLEERSDDGGSSQHALDLFIQTCVYKLLDNRSHKLVPSPLKPCKRPFLFLFLERRELWASISLQPCSRSMSKPQCCPAQVPLTCSIQLAHLQRGPVYFVRITHKSISFSYLVIIERKAHVPKHSRVIRTQRYRYAIVQQNGQWMHRH